MEVELRKIENEIDMALAFICGITSSELREIKKTISVLKGDFSQNDGNN